MLCVGTPFRHSPRQYLILHPFKSPFPRGRSGCHTSWKSAHTERSNEDKISPDDFYDIDTVLYWPLLIIDDVQRAPDLLLAIKADIDRHRIPGRYLLSGSGNVLTLPKVSDALTGRMETSTLWPLSQGGISEGNCRVYGERCRFL